MTSHISGAGDQRSSSMLLCGILAGPIYVVTGLAQAFTRKGFDMKRHALSQLSNGRFGWVQIANFIITGLLVVAGAIGLRKTIKGSRAGTWGPLLLGAYGVGVIGAGIFVADPGNGFPPGTAAPATITTSGLLHFVFGGLGFYALIASGFVFARRFSQRKQMGWVAYCIVTAVGFLISFGMIASGSKSPAVVLAFYFAVLWIWIWHTMLYVEINRATPSG